MCAVFVVGGGAAWHPQKHKQLVVSVIHFTLAITTTDLKPSGYPTEV